MELQKGFVIVDLQKFLEVYEARKDSVEILSKGVIERYELYKSKYDNNTTIKS